MAESSIQNLRVYTLAYELEKSVLKLVAKLPKEEAFKLANDLHRASSGVSHYIYEAHQRYSYTLKIDNLQAAVAEAEHTKKLLKTFAEQQFGDTAKLSEEYTAVIKQCWGLLKYLKNRKNEKQIRESAKASDELVAAR